LTQTGTTRPSISNNAFLPVENAEDLFWYVQISSGCACND
jgi:hypothetical protein